MLFRKFANEMPEAGRLVFWIAADPARGEAVPMDQIKDSETVLEDANDAWVYTGIGVVEETGLNRAFYSVTRTGREQIDAFASTIIAESGAWVYLTDLVRAAPLDEGFAFYVLEGSAAEWVSEVGFGLRFEVGE